jgi:hypothetical protein
MRTWILAFAAAMIGFSMPAAAEEYFVNNVTGNDTNNGATEQSALKTIQEAADRATDGDTVYVKATSWPYASFAVKSGGHPDYPVRFIGYHTTKTDRLDGTGIPQTYDDTEDLPNPFALNDLPYIAGPNRANGTAIDLNGYSWIEIKNFYISDFSKGINSEPVSGRISRDCTIENVFGFRFGKTGAPDAFNGHGIFLSGTSSTVTSLNNEIINCVIYNSTQNGIVLKYTENNHILYSRVYADDGSIGDISSCDYYFLIVGGSENVVQGCDAERYNSISHYGHGVTIQANTDALQSATGNEVLWCTFRDIGDVLLLRGMVHDNTFTECISVVANEYANNHGLGVIQFEDGPYMNDFLGIFLYNSDFAMRFAGKNGFDPNSVDAQSAGSDNYFVSCYFECEVAFELDDWQDEVGQLQDGTVKDVVDNFFSWCEFEGDPDNPNANVFFRSDRQSFDNIIDSGQTQLISGFDLYRDSIISGSMYEPGFDFYPPYPGQ